MKASTDDKVLAKYGRISQSLLTVLSMDCYFEAFEVSGPSSKAVPLITHCCNPNKAFPTILLELFLFICKCNDNENIYYLLALA